MNLLCDNLIARVKREYPEFTFDFEALPLILSEMAKEKLVDDIRNQIKDLNPNELIILSRSFRDRLSNGDDKKKIKKSKDKKDFH